VATTTDPRQDADRPPLVVVMGVSGSGKSTVGRALADRLALPYLDADSLHSAENIATMAAGQPLQDDDREPWLLAVGGWLGAHDLGGAVVGCSALRRRYRDVLRTAAPRVRFLHLDGDPAVVVARVTNRPGHFMPASLVSSQIQTLEPLDADESGSVADLTTPVETIVERFLATTGDR
jgi:gluconokinase